MDINSIDIVGERVDGCIDLYIVVTESIEGLRIANGYIREVLNAINTTVEDYQSLGALDFSNTAEVFEEMNSDFTELLGTVVGNFNRNHDTLAANLKK